MKRDMTTLGELISLQRGYDLPVGQRRPGTIPVVGSAGITGYHDTAKAKGPGVTIGRSGASFGKVFYVANDYWPHNAALFVTDFKGNDPLFIRYLLESLDFSSLNSGSAQQSLNRNYVYGLPVARTPISVQRRIVSVLSAYDTLIEDSQQRIRILEQMARALYREWFVEFRFPGHEKLPRIASPLGDIPQGWDVRTVKDRATVTYGFPFQSKRFNTEGVGTPVIRIRDILDGFSATFTDEEVDTKYQVKDGDILVGMDGDFHMCIWSSGRALQNQRVARFEANGEIGNLHLFLALEKPIEDLNKAIVGTTVAHLGDMHIRTIRIVWPPTGLRARARQILEPMSEQIIVLKQQTRNLRRTRDLLLPRLLRGEVPVMHSAN